MKIFLNNRLLIEFKTNSLENCCISISLASHWNNHIHKILKILVNFSQCKKCQLMQLNSTTTIWNLRTWSGIMSLHSVHWNLMAVISSIMWSINFHIYVNYHLPCLCDLSSSISVWSITFHTYVLYQLPSLCDLSPSISMRTIIFNICDPSSFIPMQSIVFHICVIYHLPYVCALSTSKSMWSITFHICENYHLPYLCDPSSFIPMQSIIFHSYAIYHLPYLCDLSIHKGTGRWTTFIKSTVLCYL